MSFAFDPFWTLHCGHSHATLEPNSGADSMERTAQRTAAVVACLAGAGVLLQLWLSLQLGIASGNGWSHGLLMYLGYFTVLTNLLVLLVAARAARAPDGGLDHAGRGAAVTAILLVGLAYHLLLRKLWDPQGLQLVADMILHYVVPLATLAWWLVLPPRHALPAWLPLRWLAWPIGYSAYALLRGAVTGLYPYYFIDVGALGLPRVLVNMAGLSLVFVVLAYTVRGMARLRQRKPR